MASAPYVPSGQGPALIATYSVFVAVTTIALALRVYVRAGIIRSFGLDDWIAVVGWLLYILFAGFAITSACHGLGQHEDLIQPPSEIPIALKWTWVTESLYAIANMVVKLSICLMLLRFVVESSHRILLYVVIAAILGSGITFFFVFIFQCIPVSFFWRRAHGDVDGQCVNPLVVVVGAYAYSTVSVICDWTMALLPWFIVRKTQMDLRTKMMVVFVLAIGSIASIAAIGRVAYIGRIRNTPDLLYELTDAAIWCACETGLGLFASCVATLKPLFKTRPAPSKRSYVTTESYLISDRSSTLQCSKRLQPSFLRSLDTITEPTIESRRQYYFGRKARRDRVVQGNVRTPDTHRSQDEEAEYTLYGDLPVLREHQYGDPMASRLV